MIKVNVAPKLNGASSSWYGREVEVSYEYRGLKFGNSIMSNCQYHSKDDFVYNSDEYAYMVESVTDQAKDFIKQAGLKLGIYEN